MKLAIIGAGLVAKTFHIPAFLNCPGVEITAIYDRKEAKAQALASPLGAAVYTDYDRLLAESGVDAVSICTRTDMHCSMAVAAAKAGKHVFLEKPMAMSAAEAEEICRAVEENGVIFMLGMLNRFRTEAMIINDRRERGLMGEIYHADARWIRRRGVPANPWFSQKELSGGGAALDIGVHTIDLAWYLMGCPRPLSVSAMAHKRLGAARAKGLSSWGTAEPASGAIDVEEAAAAFIRFEGEKSMTVTVSWAINGPDEDFNFKLYGTREGASLNPFTIYSMDDGYCTEINPVFTREDAWVEGFANETAHFADCVARHCQPITSAENCLSVQRMIAAIYESDRLGREVRLD